MTPEKVASASDPAPSPTRRQFCAFATHAASFIAVGALTSACGSSPSSPSGGSAPPAPNVSATLQGRQVTINLDQATALANVGSAGLVETTLGMFLVARTGQSTFTALSATCTHEACTVNGFGDGRFVCGCHGSTFTTSGSVVTGPATRALPQYPTQLNGSILTFTV